MKELLFLRQVWPVMLPGNEMSCFPVFEDNRDAVQISSAESRSLESSAWYSRVR